MEKNIVPLFRVEISTASLLAVESWPKTRASLASVAHVARRKQIASGLSLDRPDRAIWAELLPNTGSEVPQNSTNPISPAYMQETSIAQVQRQRFDVVRFIPAPNCEYFLEFTMKVQNFDTWLAVFDQEGAVHRAKDGLIDEVVARGVDDPSMVHLVFLVSELDTARLAVQSPSRLCFSLEATVTEAPAFEFFRWSGAGPST